MKVGIVDYSTEFNSHEEIIEKHDYMIRELKDDFFTDGPLVIYGDSANSPIVISNFENWQMYTRKL